MKSGPLRLLTVVGARPQFVKAAAIGRAIRRANEGAGQSLITEILVHTGQHYDYELSQIFFEGLRIAAPRYHLGVGSGSHGRQTGEMLLGLEPVLESEEPHMVLVYGDTNSTLAGALSAAKMGLPVAHIEAGLRSFVSSMPEEVNRLIADRLAVHLFVPTETGVENLRREGITEGVVRCGDVMYDVLLEALPRVRERTDVPSRYGVEPGAYALATVHRAANTDDPERLDSIIQALERTSRHLPTLVPLHPRTRQAVGGRCLAPAVHLVDPVGYEEMLALEHHSRVILTDSGGVQKEAYWLGVPCVTLRDETEWPETLADGWNVLAGADPNIVEHEVLRAVPDTPRPPVFGTGDAADVIVQALLGSTDHRGVA